MNHLATTLKRTNYTEADNKVINVFETNSQTSFIG